MMHREIKNRLSPSEDIKWGQLSVSTLCFHRKPAEPRRQGCYSASGLDHTRPAELYK